MAYFTRITRCLFSVFCVSIFIGLSMPSASSASTCAARAQMVKFLSDKYREQVKALGLVSTTGVMEVLVSKSGSWSILMTNAKGRTCIIAAGENWEDIQKTVKGPSV